jgi:acyl-CoA synthetase (AMP-forming)/AMP-acid ligase II
LTFSAHRSAAFTLGAQLDARAADAGCADRPAVLDGPRCLTWRELRDDAVRWAHFLRRRLGPSAARGTGHVAMLLENHAELLSLYAGCGYAGFTLFGVNTGLRGETLAGVLNHSESRLLVVEERLLPEVERVKDQLRHLPDENLLVLRADDRHPHGERDVLDRIAEEVAKPGESLDSPGVDVGPDTNLVVIYTSGTTGLPKGINNNHAKLLLIGARVADQLDLDGESVGYACMPLFHSNALFLGFQPAFHVGGALSMRSTFSASQFVPDVLRYGVSFWNYVGEPVHYILSAIEREYGGDEERILAEIAGHPDNRLRYAVGNGAAPPDIDRFVRWLGLEDMFELYGSTEAAISTFRSKNDPRGSVGEITDPAVRILNERGGECPLARLDAEGKIANYAEAVGEICRVAPDTALFQGYYGNSEANASKYRDGVYHSGDLGHVLEREGRHYLFFDGRTDDWIRKDGENFSAAQVARILQEHPDVLLAAAYGVPCAVSDELVMAALKLRPGARFDPVAFYRFCEDQVLHGAMDRKWVPDFVRIVEEFEYTQTQKILVRNLKRVHFDRRRLPHEPLYWRERGDAGFRDFSADDYEALRQEFERRERLALLER